MPDMSVASIATLPLALSGSRIDLSATFKTLTLSEPYLSQILSLTVANSVLKALMSTFPGQKTGSDLVVLLSAINCYVKQKYVTF